MLLAIAYFVIGVIVSWLIINPKTYGELFVVSVIWIAWPCFSLFICIILVIEADFWKKRFR